MYELKKLSKSAIPSALEKAMRYRLLNDPQQAESISLDILEVEPDNQQALILIILALTDQFEDRYLTSLNKSKEVLTRLTGEYDQAYYSGIIAERQARAALHRRVPDSTYMAYDHFRAAMDWYEKAQKTHPENIEDAILRWNSCVRIILDYKLVPKPSDERQPIEPFLE